jgi:formate-dependent nitrite reductase membrane component NrfD
MRHSGAVKQQSLHVAGSFDSRFLVGGFVVTGLATGGAVVKAVLAKANVDLALTEAAILLACAALLAHFTLRAHILVLGSTRRAFACGHERTLSLP